jgi:drug/metabolite transporter (DMT)-like permease
MIPVVIWGTAWTATRFIIAPGAFPPLEAAGLRFSGATVLSALVWFVWSRYSTEKVTFTPSLLWNIFWSGMLNAIAYALLYLAETQISGGLAAVIASTETFFIGLLLYFNRQEKIAAGFWIGTLLSIVGMAVVFHNRMQVSIEQTYAMGQTVLVAITFALGTVVLKEPSKLIHPIPLMTLFSLFVAAALWLIAFIHGIQPMPEHPPLDAVFAMVYVIVLASVVAFMLFFVAMKLLGIHKTSTLVLLIPIVSLIADYFLERRMFLDFEGYVGIAVVLGGVAICLLPAKASEVAAQPAEEIIIHE